MGVVTSGIPQDITIALAKKTGVRAFIETGTHHGHTTRWATTRFNPVFTIEWAEAIYRDHSPALQALGIKTYCGDSRKVLPEILAELKNQSALFWLDGHWSCDDTAGAGDECPLLGELRLIVGREGGAKDILMIDDARLYLCAPPSYHNPNQWPTIGEIVLTLAAGGKLPYIQILNDVIFATWDEEAKKILTLYSQIHASRR